MRPRAKASSGWPSGGAPPDFQTPVVRMRAHDTRHASERGQIETLANLHLPGCAVSRSGLELPATLSEDQWLEIGRAITGVRSATSWWIGDWWASGEHRYGDRSATVESDAWDGPGLQVCKDFAWVARAFQRSRRRDVLAFSHHREVAGLPPDQADALLDWAAEPVAQGQGPRSVRALRQEKMRRSPLSLVDKTYLLSPI